MYCRFEQTLPPLAYFGDELAEVGGRACSHSPPTLGESEPAGTLRPHFASAGVVSRRGVRCQPLGKRLSAKSLIGLRSTAPVNSRRVRRRAGAIRDRSRSAGWLKATLIARSTRAGSAAVCENASSPPSQLPEAICGRPPWRTCILLWRPSGARRTIARRGCALEVVQLPDRLLVLPRLVAQRKPLGFA
jgi:hypothetical protein